MTYAWHVHHHVLVEKLTESLATRQAYIREYKPTYEIPTRLRLLRLVGDQAAVAEARRAYNEAVATAQRAYTAAVATAARRALETEVSDYDEAVAEARDTYNAVVDTARDTYGKVVHTLHARECPDCPWDGHTIFPRKEETR